jgi:hypothetical protein
LGEVSLIAGETYDSKNEGKTAVFSYKSDKKKLFWVK